MVVELVILFYSVPDRSGLGIWVEGGGGGGAARG